MANALASLSIPVSFLFDSVESRRFFEDAFKYYYFSYMLLLLLLLLLMLLLLLSFACRHGWTLKNVIKTRYRYPRALHCLKKRLRVNVDGADVIDFQRVNDFLPVIKFPAAAVSLSLFLSLSVEHRDNGTAGEFMQL